MVQVGYITRYRSPRDLHSLGPRCVNHVETSTSWYSLYMYQYYVCMYNGLRSKGYTRPLSVLAINADPRAKYAKMGEQKMLKMITPMSKLWYLQKSVHVIWCDIHSETGGGDIIAEVFSDMGVKGGRNMSKGHHRSFETTYCTSWVLIRYLERRYTYIHIP